MAKFSRWELVAFILAWLLALSMVCVGAEPTWDATLAPDGQSLVLRPKLPSGVKYRLRVTPGAFSGILATVGADGFPELADWCGVITYGTAPIPPPAPPPPKPEPPPKPKPTTLWGIVLEESSTRTPAQASVILAPKVAELFKPDKGQLRVIDPWDGSKIKAGVEIAIKPYAERADTLKIRPALFVVDPSGVVYYEGKLPEKVAEVEALVAKIRRGE